MLGEKIYAVRGGGESKLACFLYGVTWEKRGILYTYLRVECKSFFNFFSRKPETSLNTKQ